MSLLTRPVRMYSRGLNTLELSSQSSLDRLPQILLRQTQLIVRQLLFFRRLPFPICKQENLQVIPKRRVVSFAQFLICNPLIIFGFLVLYRPLSARLFLKKRKDLVLCSHERGNINISVRSLLGTLEDRCDG
jgi:hypothetical protein